MTTEVLLRNLLRATGLYRLAYRMANGNFKPFRSAHPPNLAAIRTALMDCPDGDFYEFGVFQGFSLWYATQIAAAMRKDDMRFFGYDSFEGFPTLAGIDMCCNRAGGPMFMSGFCACQLSVVMESLERHGAPMDKIVLVKGWYADTLQGFVLQGRPPAVVMVDCDLYQSTLEVLEYIGPHLQAGTVLLLDDYYLSDCQSTAFAEWLEEHTVTELERFGYGQAFRYEGAK